MVDESTYNELDRYFTRSMQGDERVAFESRLAADANLKTELDWIVNATRAMKDNGRSVMKQHIATMLSGIPAREVQKYTPAKNPVSFWKKWWWAVTSGVVLIATVAFIYANVWQGEGGEYHLFDNPQEHEQYEQEHSITKDFLPDTTQRDSLQKEMQPTEDSTNPDQAGKNINMEAIVHYGAQGGKSKQPQVVTEIDSAKIPLTYAWGGADSSRIGLNAEGTRDEAMSISINQLQKAPFTYRLDNKNLLLNVDYYTTAGYEFNGSGDTVYMTNLRGETFMLLRNRGELPLVPIKQKSSFK